MGVDEDQAALLIQKTMRGRAVQLRMQKGRARKGDLITEMRVENPLTQEEAKEVTKEHIDKIIMMTISRWSREYKRSGR